MTWNPLKHHISLNTKTEPLPAGTGIEQTQFAFNILRSALGKKPDENVCLSPASLSFALSMAACGADGETYGDMLRTLGLDTLKREELKQGSKIFSTILERTEPNVQLALANSLWSRLNMPFKPEFAAMAREYYRAEARALDFNQVESARIINDWCKEKTRGRIDNVVTPLVLKIADLVLVNALYFKASWAKGYEFNPVSTHNEFFTPIKGDTFPIPVMRKTRRYFYYENSQLQAVKIPYGSGGISMQIILPTKGVHPLKFLEKITLQDWREWWKAAEETQVQLGLPRFSIQYESEFGGNLKALGMDRAFSGSADFSQMCETPMALSTVIHKSILEVNEEGTVAAAVTAATALRGGPPPNLKVMVMDRPFICAICEERTGTLLFLSAIMNPLG